MAGVFATGPLPAQIAAFQARSGCNLQGKQQNFQSGAPRWNLPAAPQDFFAEVIMKTVLLVEDNDNDVLFMKMACQRTGIPHSLQVVRDGDAAVNYLGGAGIYADRASHPSPDLVFLDLKLPGRDGLEVLKWIRAQPGLKNLPVVMLTSSLAKSDMGRAYELGVTSYLRKIASPAEFGQGVRVILKYWLELNIASA